MTTGTINDEPILRNNMAELPEKHRAPKDSSPSKKKKTKQTPKDLEAALTLLRKHDDTSRFVGLALLKPVLEQELSHENNTDEGERSSFIQRCWGAIPVKFLNRLLKARANDRRSKEEAHSMLGLAVAIMYFFMGLLESPHTDEKFIGQVRQIPQPETGIVLGGSQLSLLLDSSIPREHGHCNHAVLFRKDCYC